MKKYFIVMLMLGSLAVMISCEDTISPKSELPEVYSINMIIRTDTSLQTLSLTKLYDVEGFDPSSLKTDPSVPGAKVSIKYPDVNKEYHYRDTVDNQNINQRFGTPSKYYYLKKFEVRYGKELELNVEMPGGKKMTSKTKIPEMFSISRENTTPFIPGPLMGRDTANIIVAWENAPLEFVKMAKVHLVYFYKETDGTRTRYEKEVPLSMIVENGDTTKNYVFSNFKNELKINRQLLAKTLAEISKGNSAKGRYSISPLVIDIYLLDENLTRYFSAGLLYDFGFTIRNLPGNLSNIYGGLGFLGSYTHTRYTIKFEDQYLTNTFGYLRDK